MLYRRILHVDLDAFFVSVEQALDPSLKGKPVVVGGDERQRGVVASASYEARAYGLRSGMPLSEARRLCPQAIFIPGRYHHYSAASRRFMAILREYSPDIESGGIDEAYLDLTGCELLWGPASQAAHEIKTRIKQALQITASIGISTNKVVSKVASDHCKPDGLLEIPAGEEKAFLAPLPVRDLVGVGERAAEVLARLRIRTIGELAALSPSVLLRRFGTTGYVLHSWANGIDDRPILPPAPPKSISRETTFAHDVFDRRMLKGTLRYLAERVAQQLRCEGKYARCIALKLRYSNFDTISRQRTLLQPTDFDNTIFATAAELLDKALVERRDRVRLIGGGVSDFRSEGVQLGLLDGCGRPRGAGLGPALDRVREKYGFLAVQTGLTMGLRDNYAVEDKDYILQTPALAR